MVFFFFLFLKAADTITGSTRFWYPRKWPADITDLMFHHSTSGSHSHRRLFSDFFTQLCPLTRIFCSQIFFPYCKSPLSVQFLYDWHFSCFIIAAKGIQTWQIYHQFSKTHQHICLFWPMKTPKKLLLCWPFVGPEHHQQL